jgi:predicted 3-demethylubiquinone-9 3-methyltransferase (glyoxalase superfamily)
MATISHCLWFDGQAEEAARFYVSLVPDSRIDNLVRAAVDTPSVRAGDTLLVEFTLAGQPHAALNGGPAYRLTPALSIVLRCADQAEVDRVWAGLAEGGTPMACGWITDRFGLSWQIVPARLMDMLKDRDPERSQRVMQAMMQMVKLDLPRLEEAYAAG